MATFSKICAFIGFIIALGTFFFADSAIKEAAGSAFGMTLGGLPYIIFKLGYCERTLENQEKIIALLNKEKFSKAES